MSGGNNILISDAETNDHMFPEEKVSSLVFKPI